MRDRPSSTGGSSKTQKVGRLRPRGRIGRPRRVWGLVGPSCVLAVLLMLAAPALAAGSDHFTWKPPYTATSGPTSKSHRDITGCGTASLGPTFSNKTGDVDLRSPPFEASALACATADTLSSGLTTQTLYIAMPSFTVSSGDYKVDSAWKGTVKVSLSIAGKNCSGDLSTSDLSLSLFVLDMTSSTVTSVDAWHSTVYYKNVAVTDDGSIDFKETRAVNLTHSLGGSVALSTDQRYEVISYIVLYAFVEATNPTTGQTNPNPASCTVSAQIIPDSGSEVAELVDVVVA